MAADLASSSWHPALMPNATKPAVPSDREHATQPSAIGNSTEAPPPVSEENNTLTPESHDPPPPTEDDGHIDAWLSHDAGDDGTDWLAPTEPASQNAPEVTQDSQPHSDFRDPIVDPKTESEQNSAISAQHSKSMSFARTVSHEVNFNDDDEGDFIVQREDPDPFKFMTSSDRTNSFPVVPTRDDPLHSGGEFPSQGNQVLDGLEDPEVGWTKGDQGLTIDTVAQEESGDMPDQLESSSQSRHQPSGSMGGDANSSSGQVLDERFEEGLPLIAQSVPKAASLTNEPTAAVVGDSFAGDGERDDFFTGIQHSEDQNAAQSEIPPLQRKSTTQAMGDVGSQSLSRHGTLDDMIAEEDTPVDNEHDTDDFFKSQPSADAHVAQDTSEEPKDVSAKWDEAFGDLDDDNDFLLEDTANEDGQGIDPAAFWGDDNEGFLEDKGETTPATRDTQLPASNVTPKRYLPQTTAPQRPTASVITPMAAPTSMPAPFHVGGQLGNIPETRPDLTKSQSFADRSRGGYVSPYDLPTDLVNTVVKPRKRTSMQQLHSASAAQAPPRSVSSPGLPPPVSSSMTSPTAPDPTIHQKPFATSLSRGNSFFEDLPLAAKPRPSSRQSARIASPTHHSPPGHPLGGQTSSAPPFPHNTTVSAPPVAGYCVPEVENLVAPERLNPYASLQSSSPPAPVPLGDNSRYSPAPVNPSSNSGVPPPNVTNRYSPAPASRSVSSFSQPAMISGTPPILPHQPRTSSPLAHFETSGEHVVPDRRISSSHDLRMNRVPSLPPTREVDEEEDEITTIMSVSATNATSTTSRYSPMSAVAAHHTPPSSSHSGQPTMSPPKRASSSYVPQTAQPGSAPPRAQSQSPGTARHIAPMTRSSESGRPASSHLPTSPVMSRPGQSAYAPGSRNRGPSLTMNLIAPTDGREHDPLQRWRGVPIITWGVGGTVVTTFPRSVPRYGKNQTTPSIVRSQGEVKVISFKDIAPLEDRLAKFPGPLRGKSKKKEVLVWLTAGIDAEEKDLPEVSFHSELSLEAKRSVERLLLWKILRIFIEYDGHLEANIAAEKAVRDVLSPGTMTPTSDNDALFPGDPNLGTQYGPATSMQADGAGSATMDQIRLDLLRGDREAAVWAAADKRLWGHAMLISQTVSPDLYKRVAQEFVRKEVNYPGHNNESLAALYKIMSGSQEECVDELVPSHARAGLQLMSTQANSSATNVTMDGLDKWRETLTLVLSNRSPDDNRGLNALGKLLSSYGRAEAAHICFMFSRSISVFGGLDDPNADFVLLGSDHHQQSYQFAKEIEALQLSEIYEYGMSLAGGSAAATGAPHLAAYKLQHAIALAEYGYRDKGLQYCEAIAAAITSQTKRSPYHHIILEAAVDDFMIRLKQAPKGETTGWMTKAKVSDSMWSRFNKFVAGDENDADGNGTGTDGDVGPFARIAGTPNLSRSPSISNFDMYGGVSPTYQTHGLNAGARLPSGATSRYAPGSSQPAAAPSSYEAMPQYVPVVPVSMNQTQNEYPEAANGNVYAPQAASDGPNAAAAPVSSYQALGGGYSVQDSAPQASYGLQESPDIQPSYGAPSSNFPSAYQPATYGYETPQMNALDIGEHNNQVGEAASTGYEPPSFQPYGYEPPSYEPNLGSTAEEDDSESKSKKNSFMDEDDNNPALRPADKTKAEKDRENQEMFRKIAEEDAKRAGQQQDAKKGGWGFSGWFGGGKKPDSPIPEASPNKPIRAKLGEASSFVYDPDLKRWINKKPGAENVEAKTATPPPPRAFPRSVSGTPPPMSSTPPPPGGRISAPPLSAAPTSNPGLVKPPSMESLGGAPPMTRSAWGISATGPPSGPPSRPTTSMSNASSIDDLLGAPPRKTGPKKPRKSGRYVDVMAK